jgi:hypothetical protein
MMSGLDIHYDLGPGHPLLGRRMPDLDIATADGPLRVYELLHGAKPVLLNLDQPRVLDITPWTDRVQLIDAEYGGPWELPVLGSVSAPAAVVIRPDGYVAWVGDGTHTGLRDALTTWFGDGTDVSDMRIRVTAATPPLPSWSESRSGESVATDKPSGHAIASVPIDEVFVQAGPNAGRDRSGPLALVMGAGHREGS